MWEVQLWESERGWGQKIDEVKKFDSYEEAEKYVEEFNDRNTGEPIVPDWYMFAKGPFRS